MFRVAVTGLGCVTPIGNTVGEYWNSLIEGKVGIGPITKFDTSDMKAHLAAEVKDFDPLLYMDKGEARKTDLFTQFALAAATQAVNDAGIKAGENIAPEELGVYIGSGIGGIQTFCTEHTKIEQQGPRKVSPYFIPMMIMNMATGKVAIEFNAQGPSLPVVTACATSTNAIGEAYRAIKHGYATAIIAGGAEAAIVPLSVAGFCNCKALTESEDPLAASIPFDARRNGFVMGEGAGVVILEEYEHAVARGAKIYAEMVGYGSTCDAYHMTAPHPEAVGGARAIKQAIDEAGGFNEETSIYVNAHGTSTPLNDKSETIAIKKAFGDKAYDVHISSTKSMTGHMLGAAGAVEAIASVLAIKNGVIPPTVGYKEKDPDCDLDYTPNVPLETKVDLAFSTSLGFGGHNGCVAFKNID
ncbi:MAG: beta-ketoacyl-ACP synthase II [Clostridia bacterium]|nr:beta-ketoacyl-ACP synthase II [Clostridia bacterium]